jgi:cell division protein FtsL
MPRARNNKGDRVLWTGEDSKSRTKRVKWRHLLYFTLMMFLFVGCSLFYVWSRIQVIRFGYDISNVLKEEKRLSETNKKLRLEIATLKSYPRIERFAVEELRMAKPRPEQVIVIR